MRMPFLLAFGILAVPASAQVYEPPASRPVKPPVADSPGPQSGTLREIADVRERIADGRREGTLTRRTARGLKRETGMIGTLADRYGQDGISAAEQRELDTRTAVMRDMVNLQRMRGRR